MSVYTKSFPFDNINDAVFKFQSLIGNKAITTLRLRAYVTDFCVVSYNYSMNPEDSDVKLTKNEQCVTD